MFNLEDVAAFMQAESVERCIHWHVTRVAVSAMEQSFEQRAEKARIKMVSCKGVPRQVLNARAEMLEGLARKARTVLAKGEQKVVNELAAGRRWWDGYKCPYDLMLYVVVGACILSFEAEAESCRDRAVALRRSASKSALWDERAIACLYAKRVAEICFDRAQEAVAKYQAGDVPTTGGYSVH